jgi:hypothetical protein
MTSATVSVATPSADAHAANKGYVDSVAEGLHVKKSVVAATTAAGTLASSFENGDTVDGVTLATGERLLIKDQADASENGLYVVAASGAPSRTDDMAAGSEAAGAFAFVQEGTTNADSGWVCTSDDSADTVGSSDLAFSQFSGAGAITAGNGLAKSGATISLDLDELTAATPDVAADSFAMVDAGDSSSKKMTVTNVAGALVYGATGLTAASGIISLNLKWNDVASHVAGQATDYTVYDLAVAGNSGNAEIMVFVNGLLQRRGAGQDYTFAYASGASGVGRITFASANSASDIIIATYQQ